MTVSDDLVGRVLDHAGERHLLGIAGTPGSGKTTLARALVGALNARRGDGFAVHVPMDGFHLADVQLDRLGLRHRKGAPETFDGWGYLTVLRRLTAPDPRETVYAPAFERDLEQPVAGSIAVDPTVRVVVSEGNYLLLDDQPWRAVRALFDEVWFCDVDPAARYDRLLARHRRFGKSMDRARVWIDAVDLPDAALVEPTRARAALIVRDGDPVADAGA